MSSIKLRSYLVVITGYLLLFLIVYASLVGIDAVADTYLKHIDGRAAASIESDRACDEDYSQIERARRAGYQSVLYPDLYENSPYREIAEKFKIAPLASIPNSDLYYCNEGNGQVRYRSDRYGFRNEDSLWEEGLIDVLLIGDSFVHGACVDDDETIAGALASKGIKALNLGTASNSPIHYAAIVQTFVRVKKQKAVVVVFYPNDNIEGEEESIFNAFFFRAEANYLDVQHHKGSPLLAKNMIKLYRESAAQLAKSNEQIDAERDRAVLACAAAKTFSSRFNKFRTTLTMRMELRTIRDLVNGYVSSPKAEPLQTKLPFGSKLAIDVLQKQCQKNRCKPVFVYIPNSDFWRPDFRAEGYAALLKEYIESQSMTFLDTTVALKKLGKSAYAARGPHLSADGYRLVAEQIAGVIK